MPFLWTYTSSHNRSLAGRALPASSSRVMIGAEPAQCIDSVIVDIADMIRVGRPVRTASWLGLIFFETAPCADRIALQHYASYELPI
jgi:hypothetical protein